MATSGSLEIHTLGGLAIHANGQPLTGLASRKAEALLVYLACTGRPRSREVLAELLWEERSQSQGLSNLRVALSSLRKQLAPYLLISREAVGLEPAAEVWLDAAVLEGQLAAVRNQRGPIGEEVAARVQQALALYRGDFLEGVYLRDSSGFENWMVLERERIRAVYEQLMQWLLAALLTGRRWPEAVDWAERWISVGQTPEPAYRALMQAYAGLGDAANISAVYQRCVQALADDLEVEPTEQTRLLYAQCLKGAPSATSPALEVALPHPAVPSLRALLRQRQGGILDLPSLAAVYAGLDDLEVGPEEARLLVRSALHHGLDARPWLERAGSPPAAVRALEGTWDSYPKPGVRLRVVEALQDLPGDEAAAALERISRGEDAPEVRTAAALAAAGRSRLRPVVQALLADLGSAREAGAMAALVAVADEFGLPGEAGPFPRLPLAIALARRRWSAQRGNVLRRALLVGLGAALAWGLFGLLTPLFMALASLEDFHAALQQIPSIAAWMVAAVLMAFAVGGALGSAEGLAVGLADALWKGPSRRGWRVAAGGLAGLAHALYLTLFSLAGNFAPVAPPAVYLPVYALYGVLQGAISSLALPRLGDPAPFRRQLARSAAVGLAGAAVTVPYVFLVYRDQAHLSMLSRLVNAFLLAFGMGLGCIGRGARSRAE